MVDQTCEHKQKIRQPVQIFDRDRIHLYLIGKLFQRQTVNKERSEIIVVIIPRVYPYSCEYADYERGNVLRTEVELFEGPLLRKDRFWAPKLPDAVTNPRILRLPPVGKIYPYPATRVEMADTPQPQRQFWVPGRPGPAIQFIPGQTRMLYDDGGLHGYEPVIPFEPIIFGAEDPPADVRSETAEAVAPARGGPEPYVNLSD